eukprot:jgi/Botrbrau1/12348/Bobra.0239s0001.1
MYASSCFSTLHCTRTVDRSSSGLRSLQELSTVVHPSSVAGIFSEVGYTSSNVYRLRRLIHCSTSSRKRRISVRLSSTPPGNEEGSGASEAQNQQLGQFQRSRSQRRDEDGQFRIDQLNPYSMGRKSRQILDDVWSRFTKLSSPVRGNEAADEFYERLGRDVGVFDAPQAATTRVLVAGATGRVGRVLVRKLLLRGYSVVALVKPRDANDLQLEDFPRALKIVFGDVTDYEACSRAVEGCEKIVFCATSRSSSPADIQLVEEKGILTLSKALLDYRNGVKVKGDGSDQGFGIAKINVAEEREFREQWTVEHVGVEAIKEAVGGTVVAAGEGFSSRSKRTARQIQPENYVARPKDVATAAVNERNNLVFQGELKSEKAYAKVGTDLQPGLLTGSEGLLVRVLGDGQPYLVQVTTDKGEVYSTRIVAPLGYSNFRLPFNTFRAADHRSPSPIGASLSGPSEHCVQPPCQIASSDWLWRPP